MALAQDLQYLQNAGRTCMLFNGEQESRLQELERVVTRLQNNWRSRESSNVFATKWFQLGQAATDMTAAMERMIGTLDTNGAMVEQAATEAARIIDADDAVGASRPDWQSHAPDTVTGVEQFRMPKDYDISG